MSPQDKLWNIKLLNNNEIISKDFPPPRELLYQRLTLNLLS